MDAVCPFASSLLLFSIAPERIFLLALALSHKCAHTYPTKKREVGNEMHEFSFNKGER